MTAKAPIRCIYCKLLRPPTAAHVVPRALGGVLTAPTNCSACNAEMGQLDQALAERSLLTLTRIAETPPKAFEVQSGGEVFFDDEHGFAIELRLLNRYKGQVLPQVHVRTRDDAHAELAATAESARDLEALLDFVDKQLAKKSLRSVHVKTGPPRAGPNPRLVLYRPKKGAAFVRVQKGGDEEVLFAALEAGWPAYSAEQRAKLSTAAPKVHERPSLTTSMNLSLDDEYRAVARIAFDYLAFRFGPDVALRDELDPIRSYIRGLDVRHPDFGTADAISYDPRFVQRDFGVGPGLMPTDRHLIFLSWLKAGVLCAGVTLYRHNHYAVLLGRPGVDLPLPVAHEFAVDRTGDRELPMLEMMARMRERAPAKKPS